MAPDRKPLIIRNKSLFSFLVALLIAVVCLSWIKEHIYKGAYPTLLTTDLTIASHTLIPLFLFLCVLLCIYVYVRLIHCGSKWDFQYRWVSIAALLLVWSVAVFSITMYLRIMPPYTTTYLNPHEWKLHQLSIWPKVLLQATWVSMFSLMTYLLGSRVYLYITKNTLTSLSQHLIGIALGLLLTTYILFILGLLHLLTYPVISALSILVLLYEHKRVLFILKSVFKKRTVLVDFHSITPWVWSILFFMLSLALLDSILPDPSGFDSSTDYLNKAHLMSQQGMLIAGDKPFTYGLLATLGYLFHPAAMFAVSTNIVYAALGFLAIYGFAHSITKNPTASLLSASIFATLPLTSVFITRDIKTDILLFFIVSMAAWMFYTWLSNTKQPKHLYLSMIFLGFALSVKLTALFIITPVALYCAYAFFSKTWNITQTQKVRVLLLSALFFLIPMAPWVGYKYTTTPSNYELDNYLNVLSSYNPQQPQLDKMTISSLGIDPNTCEFTGFEEDVSRFGAHMDGLSDTLLLPWTMTMNNISRQVQADMTEIGFVFLAVCLTSLLLFFHTTRQLLSNYTKRDRHIFLVFLAMGIVYWILWYLTSNMVVWYAYPGILFLVLLTAILIHILREHKIVYTMLLLLVFSQLVLFASFRLTYFAQSYSAAYLAESISIREHTYKNATDILNSDPSTRIYMTAVPMIYHIDHNHTRILKDYYLDRFNCIDQERDDEVTLSRLQQLNINYIVYNKRLEEILPNTFQDKLFRFLEFSNNNLSKVLDTKNVTIYEVPYPQAQ